MLAAEAVAVGAIVFVGSVLGSWLGSRRRRRDLTGLTRFQRLAALVVRR